MIDNMIRLHSVVVETKWQNSIDSEQSQQWNKGKETSELRKMMTGSLRRLYACYDSRIDHASKWRSSKVGDKWWKQTSWMNVALESREQTTWVRWVRRRVSEARRAVCNKILWSDGQIVLWSDDCIDPRTSFLKYRVDSPRWNDYTCIHDTLYYNPCKHEWVWHHGESRVDRRLNQARSKKHRRWEWVISVA